MYERTAVERIRPECVGETHPDSPPGARIPLPPEDLMYFIGAPTVDNYLVVGEAWGRVLDPYLAPGARVLDIGCGSGRTARFLAERTTVDRYVGFDPVPEAIAWCERFITPATVGRFEFHRVDVRSAAYNPEGTIDGSAVRFPVPDRWAHVAVLGSVFTHLLEAHVDRYLAELSRVLVRGGVAVISIVREAPPNIPFKGDEHRMDIFPPYLEGLASRHALVVKARIGPELVGEEIHVYESVRVK